MHGMKVTALLAQQHDEVSALFASFEESDAPAARRRLFERIATRLWAHDRVEREIFYPACRAALPEAAEILREGLVDHRLLAFAILHADVAPDAELQARVRVLMAHVEQHVLDEERELFPEIERGTAGEVLEALGLTVRARFEELADEDFRVACRRDVADAIAVTDGADLVEA